MNTFNWTKAIGYGVIVWAVIAAVLWATTGFPNLNELWGHGIAAVAGGLVAFVLARNERAESGSQALGYGLAMAVSVLVLDLAVTQWFDTHIFNVWQYWLGPALALVAPWLQTETRQSLSQAS